MSISLYRPVSTGRSSPLWRNGWTGWGKWIVPTAPLADFITKHSDLIDAPKHQNGDPAWREYLAQDIGQLAKIEMDTARRRLYGILSGEQKIVSANYAEAAVMALGFDIDRDTTIPTLPGNIKLARELIAIRSGSTDELQIQREARCTIRLCALILNYPHNQERLQDLAPHDCLRPYR